MVGLDIAAQGSFERAVRINSALNSSRLGFLLNHVMQAAERSAEHPDAFRPEDRTHLRDFLHDEPDTEALFEVLRLVTKQPDAYVSRDGIIDKLIDFVSKQGKLRGAGNG